MFQVTDIESEWLDGLAERLAHPEPPLRAAGEGLLAAMRDQIEGGRLAPLSDATQRRKARLGQPRVPLIATGGLLDSLRPGGAGNVLSVDGDSVEAGTADAVAAYHVTGSGRLPRRDFTEIPNAVYDEIARRIEEWLEGGPR